jgi:hypothetical protein
MMYLIKTRLSLFGVAALLGLAAFGVVRPVEAQPTFPPKLQAALEDYFHQSFCVPQCIVCHKSNAGGDGTTAFANGLLSALIAANEPIFGGNPKDSPAAAVRLYFDANPNVDSDGDGVSDADELKAGDLPGVAGPAGQNLLCADIKYGCAGGRIAPAPPRIDSIGVFSAGLVVVGFAAMRRRRRLAKRAR